MKHDCSGFQDLAINHFSLFITLLFWPMMLFQICDKDRLLLGAHREDFLVKQMILGIYQGRFDPNYLQHYPDEYAFRFNRRSSRSIRKKVHGNRSTPRHLDQDHLVSDPRVRKYDSPYITCVFPINRKYFSLLILN